MKNKFLKTIFTLTFALSLASCLPQENQIRDLSSEQDNVSEGGSEENEGNGSLGANNYFQQGAITTTSTLGLAFDFSDSFLMRGDNVHSFIKENIAGTNNKLCMALVFPQSSGSGSNKVLVMAARNRSYYNASFGAKEYYLQMEVSNESANINDCLNVNLNSAIASETGFSSIAFKMSAICPTCSTSLTSAQALIFGQGGAPITQISLGNLGVRLAPMQSGSGQTGVTCQSDDVCRVEGFDCCLQNQCATHGQTRPSVDTNSTSYQSALEQILERPELIGNYTEYFYVCPQTTTGGGQTGSGGGGDTDPVEQAQNLFNELQDLYHCLNPVMEEYAVCSTKGTIIESAIGSGGTTVNAGNDDISFKNLNASLTGQNIVGVDYAGVRIFTDPEFGPSLSSGPDTTFGMINDDLSSGQSVTVDRPVPPDALNDYIKVMYKVNGTCERLGPSLAKCSKKYVQGQQSSPPRSTDHAAGNNSFKVPTYANFDFNLIVEVGGVTVPEGSDTWSADSANKEVDFTQTIYNNQEVLITYFVSDTGSFSVNSLLSSQESALSAVSEHCNCDPNTSCNLAPVYDDETDPTSISSYACVYGQPNTPEPPLQKTVFLSSKTTPHRYYDADGVHYESQNTGNAGPQEGSAFSYASGNLFRPNNESQYVGFNEIYGSYAGQEVSAMPATVVDIKKGKQYDIFVDSGTFSSCLNCGTDYFSNLQKLFPGNFLHMGGGYLPDMVESRLRQNQGDFSAFDMKFGRACFVPATMIPWTHKANADVKTQRRNRLQAQHFMFANGYNKDWYGFDYGALIGSFDGMRWFAIGNQRRVQAKTNKLYIAINAYFGDLTIDNSFKVEVSELSTIINSGSEITHDTDSDGAQCQKAHFCSTDNDCIAQLGYDYTCQNVAGLYTSWPVFDNNGNEVSGETSLSLLGMVGGANGQVNRCVYRGAGSLCSQDLTALSSNSSYANTTNPAFHACSPNNHCASLNSASFNDRIVRYGESPARQNNQSSVVNAVGKSDTFGLGARQIGRPFKFFGDKLPPGVSRSQLESNNAYAMCVPGKDVSSASSVNDLNTLTGQRKADKSLGIGKTMPLGTLQSDKYYAACPAVDDNEDFTYNSADKLNELLATIGPDKQSVYAASQNLSTNALSLAPFDSLDFFNDDDGATVSKIGYHGGSCLRAPGASCFTDYDCSPNSFIAGKVKSLTGLSNYLSSAEEAFWEEELVCANSQDRYPTGSLYPNPYYELKEHRCCRETGKDFSFATQKHKESDFEVVAGDDPSGEVLLPGVNQNINSPKRYSRTHTVYDKMVSDRYNYPPLYSSGPSRDETLIFDALEEIRQYKTLHLNNSRMCCTGHWVRNFDPSNGGGHKFSGNTQQTMDKTKFKSLNWFANSENPPPELYPGGEVPYHCNPMDWQTGYCEMVTSIEGSIQEKNWLEWFGKFELLGIPQVLIETNDGAEFVKKLDIDQSEIPDPKPPIDGTIKDINVDGIADVEFDGKSYYSAASYDNFEMGEVKKIFSEDSFACCVPTGVEVDGSMPDSKCCSGQVNTENSVSRCCLNDYTDLSVYTNRYVSSEGAYINGQPISDSDIDPKSGYIRKELVMEMASTMCCSGTAAYGVAIGDYFIPMPDDSFLPNAKTRRWINRETIDNHGLFGNAVEKYNAGMKYNNHVYCVPQGAATGGDGGGSTTTQN